MSKKFLSLLALLMAIIITFCACGGDGTTDGATDPTQTPTQGADPTDPTLGTEPGTTEPSDPEEPPTDPEVKPYLSAAQALYGASPNGYGIWAVSTGLSTAKRLCIDSQGYIAFEMDNAETDVAGVYNDSVLLKVNYDHYILRAVPSGELLFDSANADGARIILPEHNGKDMFREGYILVAKPPESETGTTYEMGILGPQGQWIQPISKDFKLLSYLSTDVTLTQMEQSIVYLGGGVLGLRCADDRYRYFNMNTNAVTIAQFPNNLSKHTLYDALDYDVHFIHGVSDPVYMNNNYYLFYDNGNIEAFNVLWPTGLPRAKKCGNFYYDRTTKTAYFLYDYGNGILVADSTGKIIHKQEGVKLKEYNYLSSSRYACSGFAADGYARLLLEGTEGETYYGVLGIDGQFLFDPILLDSYINTVFDIDGYRINVKTTSGYGFFAVIDHNGTLCYQSEFVKDYSVKNGVLYFNDSQEEVYIILQVPSLY